MREWRINPVMLKELRQLVRSKLVMFVLFGMLAVQMLCAVIILASQDMSSMDALIKSDIGAKLFAGEFAILALTLVFGVTGYMVIRLLMENSQTQVDLQYTTTLKPSTFVDGKVAAAAILMLLLVSASLPFLVLSYLLRGIDLLFAFYLVAMALCLETVFLFVAFYLITLTRNRAWRFFLLVPLFLFPFFCVSSIGAALFFVIGESVTKGMLIFLGVLLAAATILCLMLRAGALSAFAPLQSNRDLPQRMWWGGCLLVSGATVAVCEYCFGKNSQPEFLFVWQTMFCGVLIFSMFREVSQPDRYGIRIRSSIASPRKYLLRGLQFVFFTGGINGIVWTLLATAAMAGIAWGAWSAWTAAIMGSGGIEKGSVARLGMVVFYTFAYLLTLRAVWFLFVSRRLSPRLLWLAGLVAMLMGYVIPQFLEMADKIVDAENWFGNIFAVSADNDIVFAHFIWSCYWLAGAVLATLPEIFVAWRQFLPLEETTAPAEPEGTDG